MSELIDSTALSTCISYWSATLPSISSRVPDSSPIEVICSRNIGKIPAARASTRGTRAANVVDRVREYRAIAASCTIFPKIGALRRAASMTLANFRLPKRSRLKLIMSKAKVPPIGIHHSCKRLETPTTNCVKAGNSEPKLAKVLANCGTTLISRMPVTTMATRIVAMG